MLDFVLMLLLTIAQASELINESNMEYYLLLDSLNETDLHNYTVFNESNYSITACSTGQCPANATEYTITIPVPCPTRYKTYFEGAGDIQDCQWDDEYENNTQRRSLEDESVQIGLYATVGAVAGTSAVVAGVVVGLQASGVLPASFMSSLGGILVAKKLDPPKPQKPNMFRNIKIEPIHFNKPRGPGLSRGR